MKLVFIMNTDGLSAYVDGKLFSTVATPSKRTYMDIRFKPVHTTKYLIEKRFQTNFTTIVFYDTAAEALSIEVTSKTFQRILYIVIILK